MGIIYKYRFLLIFLSIPLCSGFAQHDLPAVSEGDLQFYLDETSFFDDEKVYQEFYLMIFADGLIIDENLERKFVELEISTQLRNSDGAIVDERNWETEAEIKIDSSDISNLVVYDQWAQRLDEGYYEIYVTVSDQLGDYSGELNKTFVAENYDDDFSVSEIEFAGSIEKDISGNSHFQKGTLSVIPNSSRRYGLLNPVLYFYYEIYNRNDEFNNVNIKYDIKSQVGTSLRSFEQKTKRLSGATSGIVHGINVASIASGIYSLDIEVELNDRTIARSSRNFEVIQLDYLSTEPVLTQEEADKFGGILKIISPSKKHDIYKELDLNGKAKFLVMFWNQNDPTPNTPENEYFQRIMERFNYANQKFSWSKIEGWKTDRGRILIKYGMPSNIQRYPFDTGTFPYEIWEYQENRNYIYVFGDLRADGRYTLLHSNREGEIFNPYWKEELERM